MPRRTRISLIIIFAISGINGLVHAERKNNWGTSIDFSVGAGNQVGQSSLTLEQLGQRTILSYSVYPSLDLTSVGKHSTLNIDYTFVGERFQMEPNLTTTSHAVNGSFAAQLGSRTHLTISDTFSTVPNFSTINVLKGIVLTPAGFQYAFEPQLYKHSSISDSGSFVVDVDLSKKSSLTFSGSSAYRHYDDALAINSLSNQIRSEESLGWSHKHSKMTKWGLNYRMWQIDYKNYPTARSHSATIFVSKDLNSGLHVLFEAGPSYTEKSYASYIVNVQLQSKHFSFGYAHNAGDTTGLGGATESHQGNLGFSLALGRKGSINFQASAFTQSQRGNNLYDYWGGSGSIALTRQVGDHWVTAIGASYSGYDASAGSNRYSYNRVYASFGYRSKRQGDHGNPQ